MTIAKPAAGRIAARESRAIKPFLRMLTARGWVLTRLETRQRAGLPDIVAAAPNGQLVWIEAKKWKPTPARFPERTVSFNPMAPAQVAFAAKRDDTIAVYMLAVLGGPKPVLIFPPSRCECPAPCWHADIMYSLCGSINEPVPCAEVIFIQRWAKVAKQVSAGFIKWPMQVYGFGWDRFAAKYEDDSKFNDQKE